MRLLLSRYSSVPCIARVCCLLALVLHGTPLAGAVWRSFGPPGVKATCMIAVPPGFVAFPRSILLVGTSDHGVYGSRDNGATWQAFNSGLGASLSITSFTAGPRPVVVPDVGPAVFVGTTNGLFRSLDGGETWLPLTRGLPHPPLARSVHALGLAKSLFAVINDALYRSGDAGESWEVVLPASIRTLKPDPLVSSTILAAGRDVYRSTDDGQTWTALGPIHPQPLSSFDAVSLGIDPGRPSTIFVGGVLNAGLSPPQPAVFRTTDGGLTWKILDTLGEASAFAFVAPSTVYSSVPGSGVLVSGDEGDSWTEANDGLTDRMVRHLLIDPANPSVLFAATDGGMFQAGILGCASGDLTLCANGGRFRVEVSWSARNLGRVGDGHAVPLTSDTGAFWFFQPSNIELVVKVLDGRAINGHFWLFYGALSDVGYTITVSDTATGAIRTFTNPEGRLASGADTAAF